MENISRAARGHDGADVLLHGGAPHITMKPFLFTILQTHNSNPYVSETYG